MKVNGKTIIEVDVNPIDFLKNLKEEVIHYRSWYFKENNKYYVGFEDHYGKPNEREEISLERYEYMFAIDNLIEKTKIWEEQLKNKNYG